MPLLSIRQISGAAMATSAVIAAGIALANVMEAGEPYWLATRFFVRQTSTEMKNTIQQQLAQTTIELRGSDDRLTRAQSRTELRVIRGQIESTKSKIADRELLLKATDGPPQYRLLIEEQLRGYHGDLQQLEKEYEELRQRLRHQ